MKRFLVSIVIFLMLIIIVVTIGGSFYMLDYALCPNEARTDTTARYVLLYKEHPEAKPWLDSLRAENALCDTFVTMPSGERHHALFVRSRHTSETPSRVALCIHGWRQQAIGMLQIARIYHQQLGCHVLLPDLHAHGLSEGKSIGMGWNDRQDVRHWMTVASELFSSHDFILHGISMGAATVMNVSGEPLPPGVSKIRFIEDCGYTSVWDEFHYELSEEFGLPDFPILYTSSLLCLLRNGWSFGEASPLSQVSKCQHPMLFIHGDNDHFVPSWMVHPLHAAKPEPKAIWITHGSEHDRSYSDYPQEYANKISEFLSSNE